MSTINDTKDIQKREPPILLRDFIAYWQTELDTYPDPGTVEIRVGEGWFEGDEASYELSFKRPMTEQELLAQAQKEADKEALAAEIATLKFTHIRYPSKL